jgi:hypothetical protein
MCPTGIDLCPTCGPFWKDALAQDLKPPTREEFRKLAAMFQGKDYALFRDTLMRYRLQLLRAMETAEDEKHLMRLQGEARVLKVIDAMPIQIANDLKRFEDEDRRMDEDRKQQQSWKDRPGQFAVVEK